MSCLRTIKLKIIEISQSVVPFQEKYNNVMRYSFNRFMEGKSRTDVFNLILSLNNVDCLDVSWKREAAKLADMQSKAEKAKMKEDEDYNGKVIFGGKGNFYKRLEGKISHEEFKKNKKLFPITCEGSKADNKGNRKFKYNLETCTGQVKLDELVTFKTVTPSKSQMRMLNEMFLLMEQGLTGITYRITDDYLYIVCDIEKIAPECSYTKVKGRTLAMDINPNYIGLSIVDSDNTILLKRVYNLSEIDDKDKKKYELVEIVKSICNLVRGYNVEYVGFEKLTIKSSNKGKGKCFNKLVNNDWCRGWFVDSLKKHLTLIGCKYQELLAQYSSFIGVICYQEDTDSIAASLELNRRLRKYKKIYIDKSEPKSEILYPEMEISLFNRWKESTELIQCKTWKSAYECLKREKHSYPRLYYKPWSTKNKSKEIRLKSKKNPVCHIEVTERNKKLLFN